MKPLVSIICITYNQEKFVSQAIEGFLMQKTTFPFEILIHDDASTDATIDIIRQYAQGHPDLFKPIFEKENQYSQGNLSFIDDMFKQARGKYIAICEGDDFWTDPEKLQRQVDFLESHPTYALCFHPMRVFFENKDEKESIYPELPEDAKLGVKELIEQNFIPTTSVMYRKQSYDKMPVNIMPKDWYGHLYHAQFGKIGFINRVMSAYRRHPGGIWWDHYGNKDKLWKTYGVAWVAMYMEVLKLYGDDPELEKTIHKGLSGIVDTLMGIDKKYGEKLLQRIIAEQPAAAEIFMRYKSEELEEYDKRAARSKQEIEKLSHEVLDLRSQVFSLRDEIHSLRNSRLVGRVILIKDSARLFLQKLKRLPRTIVYQLRILTDKIPPGPVRSVVKGVLRFILRSAKKVLAFRYQEKLASTKIVSNKPWEKDLPLVSVIIPYYNRADTIDATIDSLQKQTFKNFEIIILDDGSTEPESLQKLEDLEDGGFKARIIHQKNRGVAAARNNGISAAAGKYIICLDSDDVLDATFIEKSTTTLEATPGISLVTTYRDDFGVTQERWEYAPYDPLDLYINNMVITAAEFKKEAWRISGGYKSGIGYEDWEFWLSLSEHGFWGKVVPEVLFHYRTSMQSRFVEDKDVHWNNVKHVHALHPNYRKKIHSLLAKRQFTKQRVDPDTALINLGEKRSFHSVQNGHPNILITIPWMTFGGAETLIYNYCREIKDRFDLSFITGLKSKHEWEYKFREITPRVYHLANLFDDPALYIEFIANYIKTRDIDVLHIIHNGFTFDMLSELKQRFPRLKVVVTLFNDRVEYFRQSVAAQDYIDAFSTDNSAVAEHFTADLAPGKPVSVIPNGINCFDEYNPELFDRTAERAALGIGGDDLSVFFVGRLSPEKNPDVFLRAAETVSARAQNVKFFVIGDGPMRGEVEKQLRDIGSKHITYLGYQPEVAKYLSAADVFVLPSSIEGFPLSILEAMAMGVAVIASRVGAVPDIIDTGSEGFVVTAGSDEEIAEAIKTLRRDPALLASIKSKARLKAEEQYSTTVLGENYRKLYTQQLKGSAK